MRHLSLAGAIALLLAACTNEAPPPAEPPSPAPTAEVKPAPTPAPDAINHRYSPEITAPDFGARLKKLASDEFEGREPGELGERLTTAFIKDQFERAGLKPGNNGSWFQSVPTVSTRLTNTDLTLDVTTPSGVEKFAFKKDMVVGTLAAKPQVSLKDSDIVFVGYGVNAPEQDWNDYHGLVLKGKTVIILVNDPGFANNDPDLFKGRAMTYYGRWTYKFEEAARRGAAAAFIVHETAGAGYGWGVIENSWSGPQHDLPSSEDPAPRMEVAGWLTNESAHRLFEKSGLNFDEIRKTADVRGFKAIPLKSKLSVNLTSTITTGSSENVVGLLPGSQRADETIVYSAHWDHLGKDTSLQGDQIYNGAVDNGTGVAALIEIAEAFGGQQPPPERSVLFVAVTLEESGLLGSKYFAAHPPVPPARMVANINMDAMYLVGKARNMTIVGFGQSELDGYMKEALAAQGRVATAEETPEKGHFFRSDHFNFARKGVPALYAKGGTDLEQGGDSAGRVAFDDYTKNRYHQVSDEFRDDLPLDGVIADVQALYAVGKKLAGETGWPQWSADSEFRAAREASLKK
ncbi:M28 family metallopeptidase [Tahibacter amnicola]|uniref:M28 family metallopeptidase n=1 Tax=Tahibacter amnicola TaxID=2976241 RepID=A0ABY6BH22_9GAMM|nr:M28 family metallopeptidase [Tahibacter amnicola]UXI68623.1 M28 family metallopeptidase [Tahibacter amnicola]